MPKLVALLALCGVILAGCTTTSVTVTPQSRDERVRTYFQSVAGSIAQKEGLVSAPAVFYVMADEERLPDGRVRSLWVTDAETYRSRCFYLDVEARDSAWGYGGCGANGGQQVSLSGNAADLVGDIGGWAATQVRIAANGLDALVPVKNHYFLVPDRLTKTGAHTFTVTLLGADSKVLAEVSATAP